MSAPPEERGEERSVTPSQDAGETASTPWTRVLPDEEPEELVASRRSAAGGRPQRLLPWAFLAALTFIAFALLWSACETHYQACVQAVDVRAGNDSSALARLAREEGADRCTRSPL